MPDWSVRAASLVAVGMLLSTSPPARADEARPKLFLACPQTCFEPYLSQELSYFELVRDRYLSDWTVLVVRQRAANGGERFALSVLRATLAEPIRIAEFVTAPAAPPDVVRQQLLEQLLRVLYWSLQGSPDVHAFRLSLPVRPGLELSRRVDAWDHWTITPELMGTGEAESGFHHLFFTGAATFRRITELNKLRLRGSYTRQLSRFVLEDGSTVNGDIDAWEGRVVYARSVGQRWAVGFATTERADEGENLRAHLHGGPVIELNLFPYRDNVAKQIRIAYQAGPWMNWYLDVTRDGHLHELRPYHALTVVTDVNQRWGSVQCAVQLNSFIDEPSEYRLSASTVLSLQLFEGFALNLQGLAAAVQDQINLRARPLSDEEILLGTVQQATDFVLFGEMGFSYTFGSIHSAIVNPRFGRLDLEEE